MKYVLDTIKRNTLKGDFSIFLARQELFKKMRRAGRDWRMWFQRFEYVLKNVQGSWEALARNPMDMSELEFESVLVKAQKDELFPKLHKN